MKQIELVPTEQLAVVAENWYMEVEGKRVGYLYLAKGGTWVVGVMDRAVDGDIGPAAEGLPTKAVALEFASQHLPQI